MKKISDHALAAKNIKKELKTAYPATKFEVKSNSYAGGCSVTIYYKDGPAFETVDKIVKKYQYGDFDGMQDLYIHKKIDESKGSAKYVMVNRTITDEIYIKAANLCNYHITMIEEYNALNQDQKNQIRRKIHLTDF